MSAIVRKNDRKRGNDGVFCAFFFRLFLFFFLFSTHVFVLFFFSLFLIKSFNLYVAAGPTPTIITTTGVCELCAALQLAKRRFPSSGALPPIIGRNQRHFQVPQARQVHGECLYKSVFYEHVCVCVCLSILLEWYSIQTYFPMRNDDHIRSYTELTLPQLWCTCGVASVLSRILFGFAPVFLTSVNDCGDHM